MDLWIKVCASKTHNWSLVPRTSMIVEKGLSQIVLTSIQESRHPVLHTLYTARFQHGFSFVSFFFLFSFLERFPFVLAHWVEAPFLRGLG